MKYVKELELLCHDKFALQSGTFFDLLEGIEFPNLRRLKFKCSTQGFYFHSS